jgi:hypothetical protein
MPPKWAGKPEYRRRHPKKDTDTLRWNRWGLDGKWNCMERSKSNSSESDRDRKVFVNPLHLMVEEVQLCEVRSLTPYSLKIHFSITGVPSGSPTTLCTHLSLLSFVLQVLPTPSSFIWRPTCQLYE